MWNTCCLCFIPKPKLQDSRFYSCAGCFQAKKWPRRKKWYWSSWAKSNIWWHYWMDLHRWLALGKVGGGTGMVMDGRLIAAKKRASLQMIATQMHRPFKCNSTARIIQLHCNSAMSILLQQYHPPFCTRNGPSFELHSAHYCLAHSMCCQNALQQIWVLSSLEK